MFFKRCLGIWYRILDSNTTGLLSLDISVLRWSCQSKFSFKMTPRYFTVLNNFIFSLLIQKLRFLVIAFPFGLNNSNSVLLAFKLILFACSHCTSRARSWFISLSLWEIYEEQIGVICKVVYFAGFYRYMKVIYK